MYLDKPYSAKFKFICADLPNLATHTKSSFPGKVQMTFARADIGNKYVYKN